MLDKTKEYYAYVKRHMRRSFAPLGQDIRLALGRTFKSLDGLKFGVIALVLFSVALHYLPHTIQLAIILHEIRLWTEANALLFLIILLVCVSLSRFWGTLRAITLDVDSRWRTIRTSLAMYVISLSLAWLSGSWLIPDHPYYYLYAAIVAQIVLSLSLVTMVTVKRLMPTTGALAQDEPLDTRDNLGPFQVSALNNLIEILSNQQQVNSVALYGEWGTGKTSIYNVAKAELASRKKELIWVEVEPWRYTSQEALVLGFYEQIGHALEKAVPGIQNTANNLLNIAEPLVRKGEPFGIVETIYRWLHNLISRKSPSPAEYIARVLEREGRYLIVTIDNVERTSDAWQVYRTLQLVHFLKDSHITYVFISEKPRLYELIKSLHDANPTSYLEKFIEYEIDIFNPNIDELNKFFIEKLNSYGIPGDLADTRTIVKNFGTYRGVIKVLNLFVFELNERFFRQGEFTVNLGDKLRLDYLRAKYPAIWAHIEQNRDYYDEGHRDDDPFKHFGLSDEQRDKTRRRAVSNVVDGSIPEERREDVYAIMKELFPTLKHILDNGPASYKDTENWLLERRVASSGILDEYFARNDALAEYDALVDDANETLEKSTKKGFTSNQTLSYLKVYLKKHRRRGDVRDAIRLLIRELLRQKIPRSKQRQLLRSLLRVYAGEHKTKLLDEERVLVGILAGVNQLENGMGDKLDTVKTDLNYVFSKLWEYCENPSFMLRLLLFIFPGRNNDLYAIQRWGGATTGYERYRREVLRNIKSYYESDSNFRQLFNDLASKEWSFVFYQWANGISSGRSIPRIPEAQANFIYVNKRFLDYLAQNPDLAYECFRQDFYIKGNYEDESMHWSITNQTANKYNLPLLDATVDHLIKHGGYTARKQNNLKLLRASMSSQVETQRKNEASQAMIAASQVRE